MTHADDATPQQPVMAPAETLPRGRRGLAVAAVVAGMLSVAAGFSLLLAPFAFVFGVLALRGDGMARLMALTGMFFATVSVIVALMPTLFVVGFH